MDAPAFIGAGLHTVLGRGVADNLRALRESPPRAPQPAPVAFAAQCESVPYQLLAGEAPDDGERRLWRVLERVIEEALEAAGLTGAQRRATALFVGSSSFDISVSEAGYRRELRTDAQALPLAVSNSIGNCANGIRRRFDLRGPDYSFNTACTASANALLYADALLRSGAVQHALVVGIELFNAITAMGFYSLDLLTRGMMRPFDRARDGLALGEACAALVLGPSTRNHAFRLRGGANLCDRYSVSAANPDGSTVALVMEQALAAARLTPAAISALKAHGTASLLNDEAEVAGMRRVFGETLPPLCALKPFIGHTFGACGLGELILFCAAADNGFLIGTPGVCAAPSDLGVVLNQQPRALGPGNFMLNYFGFGGNNTSLVISNQLDPRRAY